MKNLPVASLVGAYLGEVMIRHLGGDYGVAVIPD
jgi:hypothetical protein